MPDSGIDTSIYPKAPTNGWSDMGPSGVVGLVNGINQSKLFQQTFDARQGVADAYKNNVSPDGSLDQTGLARDLARSGFGAGEALHQGTANAQAQFDLQAKQNQYLRESIGTIADMPNPTKADLARVGVNIARNIRSIPVDAIQTFIDQAPENPRELKKYLGNVKNLAVGPAALMPDTTGTIDPRTGVAPQISRGQATFQNLGVGEGQPVGRVTALPPGTQESMQGAAHMYNEATAAAGKYGQRVNPLRQAIPIMEKMKETDMGPVSERWNDLKSAAVNLGAGPLLGIDPEKIKDTNELKKYFNQYSSQAAATLGPKTNDGLATAVTSNPNMKMDKLSATELAKVALGVERMQQAGVLEFNNLVSLGKRQPSDFGKFMVDWGTKQDPRAFVYDLMTKEQQEKLKKGLPKEELDKIRNGMNIADRHGLLGDVHSQPSTPSSATNGPRSDAGNGQILSDADPEPIRAGQQYAQASPFQMRPIGNGQVQVINIRTGQVVYTGSAAGAANAQATSSGQARRILD
jgi:hypothetical protein